MKTNFEKPNNPSSVKGQAKLDWIRKYNIERFGTDDESKIAIIMAQKYEDHETALEILPNSDDSPRDPFNDAQETKPLKKLASNPKKRIENLKTLNPSKTSRANREVLAKVNDISSQTTVEKPTFEDIYDELLLDEEEKEDKLVAMGKQYEDEQNNQQRAA